MTSKPISRKIISIVTAALTMVVMCGLPAFAYAADTGVSKEETVYVVTNSTGEQQDVIVSDHLVNKGKVKTISDETTLSDIENVKGEETFEQNGDALTWDAGGNSIYYQGKTTEEVPVTMDVTYRLDDKVVSGPELQGKSGKVEIRIHYENTATYEGSTVPFIVMTGLVVTDETFKNIKVSKGKVIDDGDKLMVVGMAAPGLAQTLDIGETDLGIGSTVIISGDADKFAVEDMMTVVTNAFFEDVDSGKLGDLDYDDEISQLNKGSKALVDGSDQLYEGLDTLADNMPALTQGVGQLKDGAKTLEKGTNDAKNGAQALAAGSKELSDEITKSLGDIYTYTAKFVSGSKDLYTGLNKFKNGDEENGTPGAVESLTGIKNGVDGLKSSSEQISSLSENAIANIETAKQAASALQSTDPDAYAIVKDALDDAEKDLLNTSEDNDSIKELSDAMSSAATNLSNGVQLLIESINTYFGNEEQSESFIGGSYALWQGLAQMQSTMETEMPGLNTGLDALKKGSSDLANGEVQLAGGAKQLADGMTALNDKAGTLSGGVSKLDNGAYKLRKGMKELYDQGIKKIVDLYNDDLKGTLDSVDGMLDAGKGYKTFTKLPSSMDGNVKFIYKTDMTE